MSQESAIPPLAVRYWYAVIGPVPADKISSMGDGPPRMAARQAVLDSTGWDPSCASGWISEEEADAMQKAGHAVYMSRHAS
jgi:hypothetical protein